MTLKIDVKFEETLIFWQEFGEFWPKHSKITKICTFIGSYCAKYLKFDLKKYRGVVFNDNKEWCKIWRKTDLWFGKWNEEYGKFSPEYLKVSELGVWWGPLILSCKSMSLNFTRELCVMTMKNDAKFEEELTCRFKIDLTNWQFWPEHLKVSKMFTLMCSFWAKYILVELKRYRGFIFHDTEEWSKIWRKTDLWFGKWHGEFHQIIWKCQNLDVDGILLSKVENVWA